MPAGPGSAITDALTHLGLDENVQERERDAMPERMMARTRRRSGLGVMTELSFSAKIGLLDGKSSIELSLWLSRPPLEPLEYASPAEVTLDPFASGRVLS